MSQTRQSGCNSPDEVRANKMQIMKLDSCGSALFLSYLQHLCDTAVMADKKTEVKVSRKQRLFPLHQIWKATSSSFLMALPSPESGQTSFWRNWEVPAASGKYLHKTILHPVACLKAWDPSFFLDALLFCTEQRTIPFLPLQETDAKSCQ